MVPELVVLMVSDEHGEAKMNTGTLSDKHEITLSHHQYGGMSIPSHILVLSK